MCIQRTLRCGLNWLLLWLLITALCAAITLLLESLLVVTGPNMGCI
jgi:hypothetical protein